MTENSNETLEILVHTSAPSRNQDDENYRALARSYLGFKPVRRLSLSEEPLSGMGVRDKGKEKAVEVVPAGSAQDGITGFDLQQRSSTVRLRHDLEEKDARVEIFRKISLKDMLQDDNKPLSGSFQTFISPNVSFSDVIDNADSPQIRSRVVHHQENNKFFLAAGAQDSRETSPSVINDSQPQTSQLDPSYSAPPLSVLELYLQNINSAHEDPLESLTKINNKKEIVLQKAVVGENQRYLDSQFNSRGEITAHVQNELGEGGVYDEIPETSMSSQISLASRVRSVASTEQSNWSSSFRYQFVHRKDTNNESLDITNSSKPLKRRKTEDLPMPSIEGIKESGQALSSQFADNTLEVHPPGPVASIMDLTPDLLLSKPLIRLSERMRMSALFRPKSQLRPLRPMERGYWSVNCQAWDDKLQRRAWKCLYSFIGNGEAGWGVWSVRDAGFEDLRVYCWGVVVGHIYLLLYMASESKVRNTGASWIGGDGTPIIIMSP
ncbi:hypothetical protein B7463_g7139, partial [Scytalidium lignicola]